MAVLDPADSTEANAAVTLQSLSSGVGIKSAVTDSVGGNQANTVSNFGGIGIKSSVVLVDGLIDFTIIDPANSYQIVDG